MSKETKFTPGPWRVEVDNSSAQVQGFPLITSETYTVVGNEGMYGDIDTDYANAHLIAAAPDLYEALERCVSSLAPLCLLPQPLDTAVLDALERDALVFLRGLFQRACAVQIVAFIRAQLRAPFCGLFRHGESVSYVASKRNRFWG